MIITVGQLKFIHYFYFAMAIFGFVNAFFVGFESLFSLLFLAFYVLNSLVSWYMASVARKRMRRYVVIQSRRFLINHVILTVATVGLTLLIWVSGLVTDINLLRGLMTANYFTLFLAGLWYALSRTDLFKELFTVYDSYLFRKSRDFIIRIREKYRRHFGREIVSDKEIREYSYGTIREVDSNLMSAYQNRSKLQYVLECLGRIEMSLARHAAGMLKERIGDLRMSTDARAQRLAQEAERTLAQKEENIREYERNFYSRAGEPGLIS
jgi:hypothetical protein